MEMQLHRDSWGADSHAQSKSTPCSCGSKVLSAAIRKNRVRVFLRVYAIGVLVRIKMSIEVA
jgi:hypothetical protein